MGAGQAGVASRGQLGGIRTSHHAGGYVQLVVRVARAAVLVLGPNTGLAAVMTCQACPHARVHSGLALSTFWRQTEFFRCFDPTLATCGAHTSICLALITARRTGETLRPPRITGIPCWAVRHTPSLKVEPLLTFPTLSILASNTGLAALMARLTLATLSVLLSPTHSLAGASA